jgi:tryptophan synthase alpha chain
MSRIQACFERLKAQGRRGLIPFVTAGDPSAEHTVDMLHALADAGADVIELGVPFSDPMADGPVIQRSSERALARGVGLRKVLDYVTEFRKRDTRTPIVLMGYANPIERMGEATFIEKALAAGVDGVLVVDYPPEESHDFAQALQKAGMDPIFLLAPTSTEARIAAVTALASGYLYYVSLKGVTGAANLDAGAVQSQLPAIRRHTSVPVGVGFGISDARSACAVAESADAVVIGSALIRALESAPAEQAAATAHAFIQPIRAALDAMFSAA